MVQPLDVFTAKAEREERIGNTMPSGTSTTVRPSRSIDRRPVPAKP